ncbi:MAG: tRNA lysidine(34) synthetase TilS [Coraliomargarita sp.]|nr:tRNA lysidine(34) synthetase TilS [Coraliomargarita sp.]
MSQGSVNDNPFMTKPPDSSPWPELARSLRARMGARCLHPRVEAFLRSGETTRVLVACSGGPDSVCMLALLWATAESLGFQCVVAHYNHRWRGEASDQDAEFVRVMASGLGCEFATDVRPEKEAAFTETTARALRLDFLRKAAEQHDCGSIAFGHQQCDILETQLQRLARGSGSDGLAAPRPVNHFEGLPTHVRPLLNIRAGDVRMALAASGLPWREDSSNEDVSIARNALRRKIIPLLGDALGRDVSAAAARSRRLLEEDAAALDHLARVCFSDAFVGSGELDREALKAAPVGLTRRALTAWLAAHDLLKSLSATAVDLLIDSVYHGPAEDRHSAGTSFVVFLDSLIFIETTVTEPAQTLELSTLEAGQTLILPSDSVLETEFIEIDPELRADIFDGTIDEDLEAFIAFDEPCTLQVRGWLAGDRFRPLGAPGSRKLKDWFIDRQIPQLERKQLPVVLSETGEILWVPGFAPAESFKIRPNTKLALRLTYQRGLSL